MWWDCPVDLDRFTRTLSRSHTATCRVELWSGGKQLSESAPIIDGAVTDEWVTGIRRSLSLSVPPSRKWLAWLDTQPLTIRPYRGIRFSPALTIEVPLGVFDALPPGRSLPADRISLSLRDRWERVGFSDFTGPAGSETSPVTAQLARLIRDALLPDPTVETANLTVIPGQVFTRSRMDAITDLASAVGVECFVGRDGLPVIRDVPVLGAAVAELTGVSSVSQQVDWSKVYNAVEARSTANDVDFDPQTAHLAWTGHPAHPNQTGWLKVYKLSSAAIRTQDQAVDAAAAMLPKVSAIAGTLEYRGVVDPRLDASDCVMGPTPIGSMVTQIKSVTTPLQADDPQVVQTIMTRML